MRNWLVEMWDKLNLSPLRSGASKPVKPPLENLKEICDQLDILIRNLDKRVSIVVMGEVKAGKPTLINALVGDNIAPTNVLECTSAIMEIEFAPQEEAVIVFHDGSKQTGTITEIKNLLDSKKESQCDEFFRRCQVVKISYPLAELRNLRLVDTPGIETVTGANEAIANKYIQEADVILWVLDANTLANTRIIDNISKAAKMGKPLVVVLNRIDQVDGDPEELVDYVFSALMVFDIAVVLPLSAKKAYEAVRTDDERLLRESGFVKLRDYLEQNINMATAAVKDESARSSAEALLRLDLAIHDAYLKQLAFLEAQLGKHREEVCLRSEKIVNYLQEWLQNRVYLGGGRGLLDMELNSLKSQSKVTPELIQSNLSREAVARWWEKIAMELNDMFAREWEKNEQLLIADLQSSFEDFENTIYVANQADQGNDLFSNALTGVGEGLKFGSVAAASTAAYLAWLGPNAATIAFIPAAAAVLPTFLISGGVAGLIMGAMGLRAKKKKHNDLMLELKNYVNEIRNKFVYEFLRPTVFPQIKAKSEEVAYQFHQKLVETLCNNWSMEEIDQLRSDLQTYLQSLELLMTKDDTMKSA